MNACAGIGVVEDFTIGRAVALGARDDHATIASRDGVKDVLQRLIRVGEKPGFIDQSKVEVEAMRESVQLQAKAAARVLAGRQAILKDMSEAITISEADLTKQLPEAKDIVLDG